MKNVQAQARARLVALMLGAAGAAVSAAAEPARPFELSLAGSVLALREPADDVLGGVGLRAGRRLGAAVALEGELLFFPGRRDDVLAGGRKTQALFGLRLGRHGARGGVFVKARAGVVRFGEGRAIRGIACIDVFPPAAECYEAETRLALEWGGGAELFPGERTLLRLDVADLLARRTFDSHPLGRDAGFEHHLQVTLALGLRF